MEENKALHKAGYDNEMKKREEIRQELARKKKDLEDRREKKRQEKLRKIEMERRNKLRG